MDEEIYNQLVEKAKEQGYDVSKLRRTTHTDLLHQREMKAQKIQKEYGGSNQSLENDQGLKTKEVKFCTFEFINDFVKLHYVLFDTVKTLCLILWNCQNKSFVLSVYSFLE